MSILTKTLVVLVTILSIVLVALVVPLVATQDDLSQKLANEQNARRAADKAAAVLQSELAAAQASESQTIALLNQKIKDLTADVDREKAAKVQYQADAQQVNAQMAGLKVDYTVLANAMKEHVSTNKLLTDQLAKSQERVQTQGTRSLQLADALDAVTSERDVLHRRVRHMKEDAIVYEDQIGKLQGDLDKVPDNIKNQYITAEQTTTVVTATDPIAGEVVAVQNLGDGLVLVQINVGQSDKVKEGMKFLVHQGDDFKGTLVINRVEPRQSVGRMELVKANIDEGDSVYAGPY